MKGINVKKIAAFAGMAVLFGASVAVADVMYGNMQLVDQNGQPTVKVVVGNKAMVSDGVAAANIAAKIANEAYKSSVLTAGVSGTPTCAVGSGTSGTGACALVESSKKVTLEVTLPGTIAGTHTFKTLISDSVDKMLANRVFAGPDDVYDHTTASSDQTSSTNPLRAVTTAPKSLYRIGSDRFTGFADYSVVDTQSSGTTYTEEQSFWIGTSERAVAWDSGPRDVVVSPYTAAAYSIKFTGNDYGISVCTGGLASNASTYWASCDATGNDRTEKHRVKIKFLGAEWIISSMTNPTDDLNSTTAIIKGGEIKLAKEAKYGIVNVGGVLDAGNFKIRLSDISVAVGSGNEHPAIIDVLDAASEAVVGQIQVTPGTTYTFTQSGTSNSVKIHVYKTAPGFTLNAKWAEMAVYTDEITLKSGYKYDLKSDSDANYKFFKVLLNWKNKDWSTTLSTNVNTPDTLREIVVYQDTNWPTEKTKAGDVYNFLKLNPTFKLTYNGLDLTDDDRVALTITAPSASTAYPVAQLSGADASCTDYNSYTSKVIKISTDGNLLGGSGNIITGSSDMFSEVLFDPHVMNATKDGSGYYTNAVNRPNGTNVYSSSLLANETNTAQAFLFWKSPNKDCYNWQSINGSLVTKTTVIGVDTSKLLRFDTAGDSSSAQGGIAFVSDNTFVTGYEGAIVLQEDAGKNNSSSTTKVYTGITYNGSTSDSTIRFRLDTSNTQLAYYQGVFDSAVGFGSRELPFISERGSKVISVSTSDAKISVAKKIAMPTFMFAYADTTTATGADEYTMGVGESKVFGGVTVKVKAIDANCGSCSVLGVGGQPACTVDSTGVSAVIKPDNTASVEVSQPVKLQGSLVVMDNAASGISKVITVGGPSVNTVTADALKDAAVDFNTQPVVVKEIGQKIVVAGLTADDTMAAADQFIKDVKRQ